MRVIVVARHRVYRIRCKAVALWCWYLWLWILHGGLLYLLLVL